ncbi:MAG: GH1 family beta-glucosidase [Phycisphaerales bacterium]
MPFPPNFTWGAAASAYQIEGATSEGGRGPSIWDDWTHTPGNVWNDQSGDDACDHYHRMEADVQLMRTLGLRAYRFSIAWPRVMPQGRNEVNPAGLDFYSRLVDTLLDAGITPFPTLFHWDLPSALHRRGGWLNRGITDWFAEYTRAVVQKLGDRVRHWMTLNEPQVFIKFGHGDGTNAPGFKLPLSEQLLIAHHAMLAHGLSVQAIRAHSKLPARVGWAPVCVVKYPATQSQADVAAARTATLGSAGRDLWNNSWFNDPVFFGEYPPHLLRLYGADVPQFDSSDMQIIRQPMDFLGLNIYEGQPVRTSANPPGWENAPRPLGHPLTAFRWPVEPTSLYWGPRFMHERYDVPIYITENGLSSMDWPSMDGKVHDPQRIDFTRRYLTELRRAGEDGVDIAGYFHWSLMDNFEWAAGYRERFGLVYVDYPTQERIPKDSSAWYRAVIESNGASLDSDPFRQGFPGVPAP